MEQDKKNKEQNMKKGFFSRFFENMDKKMQENARISPCCCGDKKDKERSCCK